MVAPNLYGNIIDNISSGLVGGAGVAAGASYSAEHVVYEPVSHCLEFFNSKNDFTLILGRTSHIR